MKEEKNMKKQNRVILDEVKLWKCVTLVQRNTVLMNASNLRLT